jgi:hypothetical protein
VVEERPKPCGRRATNRFDVGAGGGPTTPVVEERPTELMWEPEAPQPQWSKSDQPTLMREPDAQPNAMPVSVSTMLNPPRGRLLVSNPDARAGPKR